MKKLPLLTAFVFLVFAGSIHAAPGDTLWTRTYGGLYNEEAFAVHQTSDGGFIAAGYTESFGVGVHDFYLVKTDAFGDTLWSRTYGGWIIEMAFDVQQTNDGGYIIAGFTVSFGAGNEDFYLVKTDSQGDTLWTATYGGVESDGAYSVKQTADGGYIIAGHTENYGAGGSDIYLVKTDSGGRVLWTNTYGGPQNEVAYEVHQLDDAGYVITGTTLSYGAGGSDMYMVRTDSAGNMLWSRTYGGSENEAAYSAKPTNDGGYILAGFTMSFSSGDEDDYYLVKTDSTGDTLWTRTFGGDSDDMAHAVQQTMDGGYIISGLTGSFGVELYDAYLVKTDSNGDTLWTRTYGGPGYNFTKAIDQTDDEGFIAAGVSNYDLYLVRIEGGNVNEPPEITNIRHNPQFPSPAQSCEIRATITDIDGYVDYADLYYDAGSGYLPLRMNNTADTFYASVSGQNDSAVVNYYISAIDDDGDSTISDTRAFYATSDKPITIYMIAIDPPIFIQPGGYFRFVGALSNDTPVSANTDVWIMIKLPGGTTYGPISKFTNIPLTSGQVMVTEDIRQDVPVFAPAGTYEYYAYCGSYPHFIPELVYDSTSFPFTVSSAPLNGGAGDWVLSGWFDGGTVGEIPSGISLMNNYPNPFNARTTIEFELPQSENISLDIYNINGQLVESLYRGFKDAGKHVVSWDASHYASGVYFYRLTSGNYTAVKKMNLVK